MELLKMIFGSHDLAGQAVNVVILVLFAAGVRDILGARRKLRVERKLVRSASQRLGEVAAAGPEALSAVGSGETVLGYLGVPMRTLLGERIRRIMQLREAGMGNRDVLQQLTTEHIGGYGSLARQIGSSLTLLGLLGTVFGLSLALLSIGDASVGIKGIDDLSKLSRALAGTMGGMKTAFGCTLAGLLTALSLSFLNHGLRRLQSEVVGELEEFLVCRFLPIVEKIDPDADSAAKAFAGVLERVSAQLTTLSENMVGAAEAYRGGSAVVQGTLDKLDRTVSDFSTVMTGVASGQKNFTETMDETRKTLAAVKLAVEQTGTLLGNQVAQVHSDLVEYGEMQRSVMGHHEDFKRLVGEMQKSVLGHHEEFKRLVGETQRTLGEALGAAVHIQAQESRNQLASLLKGHTEGMQGVMQSVSDLVLDVHQLNGRAKLAVPAGSQS
jgi:biopolymer transport protein ExbB/TolQ